MGTKGCLHNVSCRYFAGRFQCRCKVRDGTCNPPQEIRVKLGLPLSKDIVGFWKLLKKHRGRIPVVGW